MNTAFRARLPKPKSIAELVEQAAEFRNDPAVPRQFIDAALEKIRNNEVKVLRYPGCDMPSLRETYRVATELQAAAAGKH